MGTLLFSSGNKRGWSSPVPCPRCGARLQTDGEVRWCLCGHVQGVCYDARNVEEPGKRKEIAKRRDG